MYASACIWAGIYSRTYCSNRLQYKSYPWGVACPIYHNSAWSMHACRIPNRNSYKRVHDSISKAYLSRLQFSIRLKPYTDILQRVLLHGDHLMVCLDSKPCIYSVTIHLKRLTATVGCMCENCRFLRTAWLHGICLMTESIYWYIAR